MKAYEKLGAFYLGRPVQEEGDPRPESGYLLYDSKDLTTHAVCVGMTGSGKTGLCISLLEEAALDGVPAIAIDPKGDLGNLMLTFPELDAASFEPWVNEDEARKEGISVGELASRQAELWRRGLGDWDQSGERIERLRGAVDLAIYTPGSEAGLPISILGSLAAPPPAVVEDGDLFHDRVATTATSLLTLLGIEADPIRSREHILLSTLLTQAWGAGRDLDLGGLIRAIQEPPVERVGVVDLETFYPAADRFELAMRLNGLLASPGFQSWLVGEPLDVGRLLYTESGRPRLSILSIAHLPESERMFFVSLLLNEVLSWVRTRPGTSSLRAILYMDEIFGFMPPVAEPPSKRPLLTLLKQARAYGLGVVLATQNPVDLDYKGLSNTGTWFLGRLQTERDKLRVLDGLEGIGQAEAGGLDRKRIEALLSGLGKRVFLLHNVHESEPVLFRTRWAMSYLRGPLTRDQIRRLMKSRKEATAGAAAGAPPIPAAEPAPASGAASRPIVPPGVEEVFLPVDRYTEAIVYRPGLLGRGRVHYTDRKRTREAAEEVCLAVAGLDASAAVWAAAADFDLSPDRLATEPIGAGSFAPFGPSSPSKRLLESAAKQLAEHLYRERRFVLYRSPLLDELSHPGESERDFRIRLAETAREARDEQVEALRERYAKRLESLRGKVSSAETRLEREREQASSSRLDTAISMGTTILSAFLGRRRLSSTTLSKAGTSLKGLGRAGKEKGDVRRAEAALADWERKLEELETELEQEIDTMEERYDPQREELERLELRPRRTDVQVEGVALGWIPCEPGEEGAWLTRLRRD